MDIACRNRTRRPQRPDAEEASGGADGQAAGIPKLDYDEETLRGMAKTLWGECRSETETQKYGGKPLGRIAVAWVIRNRVEHPAWRGDDIRSVCMKNKNGIHQFSCWNPGDRNLPKLKELDTKPDSGFRELLEVVRDVSTARSPTRPAAPTTTTPRLWGSRNGRTAVRTKKSENIGSTGSAPTDSIVLPLDGKAAERERGPLLPRAQPRNRFTATVHDPPRNNPDTVIASPQSGRGNPLF